MSITCYHVYCGSRRAQWMFLDSGQTKLSEIMVWDDYQYIEYDSLEFFASMHQKSDWYTDRIKVKNGIMYMMSEDGQRSDRSFDLLNSFEVKDIDELYKIVNMWSL